MPPRRSASPRVSNPTSADANRAIPLALLATLVLQILGWRLTTNWLWGVGALHAWPAAGAALVLAFGALGLVPPLARRWEPGLRAIGRAWERAGIRGDLLVAGAFGVLLFVLRDPLRAVGDSMIRAGLIARLQPGLLKPFYPVDLWINARVTHALWQCGMDPVRALQLVGAVVGATFAFTTFRFLRVAGARAAALPVCALVVLGGAIATHFAGYDKFGPLLVGLALAALGALRLARHAEGFGALGAGVVLAILSHRSGYLVLPAAVWAAARAWPRATPAARRIGWLGAAATLAALVVTVPHTLEMFAHVDRPTHLPGGDVTRARTGGGAWPALLAISDALNTVSFLVPLWPSAASAGTVPSQNPIITTMPASGCAVPAATATNA